MKKLLLLTTVSVLVACSAPSAQTADKPEPQAANDEEKKAPPVNQAPADFKLVSTDLGQGMYMLVGRGGNIGLSTGSDGAFVIDDQFANLSVPIIAKINDLTDGPIRFVANTHYHGDHAGGNAAMRETGASVVAHDNVRVRMSQSNENLFWGRTVEATEPDAWPDITFSENMTFHFNGQTIDILHIPTAHTDGDSIVYFREADVLHMGDNFFNGMFPYVDVDSGGSVAGMINALNKGLEIAGANTKIIPGHGALSTKADMQKTRDILADVQSRVKKRLDAGDSLDTILGANVLSDFSDLASFINEENMVRITYRSLTGRLN